MALPLCYSNEEWLANQINHASSQFSLAYREGNTELKEFWFNRWNRLERHSKDLRGK